MEILGDRLVNITLQNDVPCKIIDATWNEQKRINKELISYVKVHQNLAR